MEIFDFLVEFELILFQFCKEKKSIFGNFENLWGRKNSILSFVEIYNYIVANRWFLKFFRRIQFDRNWFKRKIFFFQFLYFSVEFRLKFNLQTSVELRYIESIDLICPWMVCKFFLKVLLRVLIGDVIWIVIDWSVRNRYNHLLTCFGFVFLFLLLIDFCVVCEEGVLYSRFFAFAIWLCTNCLCFLNLVEVLFFLFSHFYWRGI